MNIFKDQNICINNPKTRPFLADCFYPDEDQKFPLIIFAHGYKGFKDWGTFNLMAEKFAEAGFVFVKFNFSHNGTTLENPTSFDDLEAFGKNTFTNEMTDFECVVDYFSQHPKVDSSKIAIIGHSRGGGSAILQAFRDDRVKTLITVAGVERFANRVPEGDRLQEYKDKGVFYSENKRTNQNMPHYLSFYDDFIANQKELDIQHATQNLKKPFLIIHGTNDEAVKLRVAHLLHKWCKTSELFLIQNANHTFGAKEPWNNELLPNDVQVLIEKSISFLNKNN